MRKTVHVIARARVNSIVDVDSDTIRVHTTAAPADGDANAAVLRMLAKHVGVPKTSIKIIRGHTTRTKVIEY